MARRKHERYFIFTLSRESMSTKTLVGAIANGFRKDRFLSLKERKIKTLGLSATEPWSCFNYDKCYSNDDIYFAFYGVNKMSLIF
jgi:hypothetical protein